MVVYTDGAIYNGPDSNQLIDAPSSSARGPIIKKKEEVHNNNNNKHKKRAA